MASSVAAHEADVSARVGSIPVVLIACSGRSGSTLLDRTLGAHEGLCSVGELRFVWERSFAQDQLCGCGARFGECPFWQEVTARAFGDPPALDVVAAQALWAQLDHIRRAPWLLAPSAPVSHRSAVAAYRALLARLYRGIAASAQGEVIVDSSGDGAHGLLLAQTPGISLHVVHLVRDARAVAFSWTRTRTRPEIHWAHEDMPRAPVARTAARWVMQNLLIERLAARAHSYRRLRYEDLVADPQTSVNGLLRSLQPGAPSLIDGHSVDLPVAHTVSGNPMRFKTGPIQIRADDEWRDAMSRSERRSVEAIAWPLLARYGYPVRA